MGRTAKACASNEARPTNLTQLHRFCQEEGAKILATYRAKLVEGYPKHLTVRLFEGHTTKYYLCM